MPNRLFDSDSTHPDFESYEVVWENIIDKEIRRYEKEYNGCIRRIPFEKQAIWEQYRRLNEYCKKNYMENSGDLIDRHKVAACYLIAVAIVSPMRIDYGIIPDTKKHFIANDVLAITVGLSVLRGFVKAPFKCVLMCNGGEQYTLSTIALVSLASQIVIQCFLDHP